MDKITNLSLQVESELQNAELESIARELIQELETIEGISSVEPLKTVAPTGAKGEISAWSTIVITLVSSGAFNILITTLSNWVTRDRRRSIEIKLGDNAVKLSGINKKEQGDALAMFVARTRPTTSEEQNE